MSRPEDVKSGVLKKKKKSSEWCVAEDKAKNQKGLGPTLSLTT